MFGTGLDTGGVGLGEPWRPEPDKVIRTRAAGAPVVPWDGGLDGGAALRRRPTP